MPDRHPLQVQHAAGLLEELPVPKGSAILSDRIGFLPARQANSRHNPFQEAVREVRVMTDTGKVLRILSNDLDATANEIADLYKRRWAIELFFRWIKQTLRITRFLGTSENAVRIQIAVALIAFLLLRLAQAAQNTHHKPARLRPPRSAPTSCIAGASISCSNPASRSNSIHTKWHYNGPEFKPDSSGRDPATQPPRVCAASNERLRQKSRFTTETRRKKGEHGEEESCARTRARKLLFFSLFFSVFSVSPRYF